MSYELGASLITYNFFRTSVDKNPTIIKSYES